MKALADADSLLSLEYMGLLDEASSIAELYTTNTVEEELREIAGFNDEKSRIARKIIALIQEGKLRIFDTQSIQYSKYIAGNVFVALCSSEKIPFLIIDDPDAAYYLGKAATQKGIKLRTCAAVLMELVKSGRIAKSDAKAKLSELMTKRSWEGGVLEVLVRMYMEENAVW